MEFIEKSIDYYKLNIKYAFLNVFSNIKGNLCLFIVILIFQYILSVITLSYYDNKNKSFAAANENYDCKCRYIIWTLVMLRLAIPFGAPFLPALFNVDIPAEFTRANEGKTTGGVGLGQSGGVADYYRNTQNIPASVMPAETNPVSAPISDNAPVAPSVTDIFSVAAYIYFAAASLLFAVKLIQYAAFTFKINMGKRNADEHVYKIYGKLCEKYKIRRAPILYVSETVGSPILFGFFMPKIILPKNAISGNSAVGILAHELTHYKRCDLWIKLVMLFTTSLHMYNPLVHIAAKRCEQDMELSCDEAVLDGLDDDARRSYGNVMLDIVKRCSRKNSALTTHFNPKVKAVKERFINILDGTKKRRGVIIIAAVTVLCLTAGTLIACNTGAAVSDTRTTDTSEPTETIISGGSGSVLSSTPSSDDYMPLEFKKVEITDYSEINTDYSNMTVSETFKLNNGAELAFYTQPGKEITEFVAVYIKSGTETSILSGFSAGGFYKRCFIIEEYDNILGVNGYTIKYYNRTNGYFTALYTYTKDMPLHLLDFHYINAVVDLDGDGSCEVTDSEYIYTSKDNTVSYASYTEQIQKYKSDDTNIVVGFTDSATVLYDANTFVIYSEVNMDENTGAYDNVTRTAVYKDGGLYFTSENIKRIDYNKKYKTNSEKWSLYFDMKSGDLILECTDGRKYSYGERRGTDKLATNGIQFDVKGNTDCTIAILNKDETYAAIVFPVPRFMVDNPYQERAIVIDLGTGYILDTIYVSVDVILNTCDPSEHIEEKLKLYQSDGSTDPKYSVTCVPSLSGDSFKFVFTLQTEDGAISLSVDKYYSFGGNENTDTEYKF